MNNIIDKNNKITLELWHNSSSYAYGHNTEPNGLLR